MFRKLHRIQSSIHITVFRFSHFPLERGCRIQTKYHFHFHNCINALNYRKQYITTTSIKKGFAKHYCCWHKQMNRALCPNGILFELCFHTRINWIFPDAGKVEGRGVKKVGGLGFVYDGVVNCIHNFPIDV